MVAALSILKEQAFSELTGNILPFWMTKAIDEKYGGFTGRINGNGMVVNGAEKGGILNARILWTFSAAFNLLKNETLLNTANRSYEFIIRYFFDEKYKGTYWKITYDGEPADTKKQIYSQAFFIYALSAYYKASGNKKSLDKAIELFQLIEEKSYDRDLNGYLEAYSREWDLLQDLRLSDKDANEKKTTNTHLHILEAYTNLYRVWNNDVLALQLTRLVHLFLDKIIDPVTHHLLLFFNENWQSKSSLVSYGHDIEASWLIYDAALALNDKQLIAKAKPLCIQLAIASLEGLQSDGSLIYERDDAEGILDMDRHWWPQAETVAGLLNLYQLTGDKKYAGMAVHNWQYIQENLVDRQNGEWFWSVRANGEKNVTDDKAGFWKCPYHNARACMEIISRLASA